MFIVGYYSWDARGVDGWLPRPLPRTLHASPLLSPSPSSNPAPLLLLLLFLLPLPTHHHHLSPRHRSPSAFRMEALRLSGPAAPPFVPAARVAAAWGARRRGASRSSSSVVAKMEGGGGGKGVPTTNYVVPLDKATGMTRPLVEILRDLNKRVPDKIIDPDTNTVPWSVLLPIPPSISSPARSALALQNDPADVAIGFRHSEVIELIG